MALHFKEYMIRFKILCLGLMCLLNKNADGQNYKTDSLFIIEKSMIQSFNVLNFEIELTAHAKQLCRTTDFSVYRTIGIINDVCVYPLHESTMSLRPSYIFIYRNGKSITTGDDKIRIMAQHLSITDSRLQSLKEALSDSVVK